MDEVGDSICEKGREYGIIIGRLRRCGWFDFVVVRYVVLINGIDKIVFIKFDMLFGFLKIKVCRVYKYEGKILEFFFVFLRVVMECEFVYEEFEGWSEEEIKVVKEYD